ncbi:MAG: U32 family peptidase, partial [Kiritimatiellae bacterium]|nr:U32 family peptidase [Kiritimatiellia bacterium]
MRSSEETSRGTELLSPAGDFDTALAAFDAGADAVYCGLADFSARAFAKNFTPDELRDLMRVARERSRKVYVTFNTLVEEEELPRAAEALSLLESLEVDGVIVQDIGVARLCARHFPRLSLHASTQLVAHNLEGVLALKELGFRRVVLARELTLEEVSSIAKRCGVEIECFIHGALCYSLSGLCLFSAMEKGRSGNRGRCAYCCRLPFDGAYPFSMKDLRLGEDARLLAQAGVASLKIEGRMKSALYVASVVKRYREILDGAPQTLTDADLETVFSRRTTPLYLHGERDDVIEPEALGHLGTPIGEVKRVTKDREGRRWIRFHASRALERHDGLQFLSTGGGKPIGFGVGEMRKALSRSVVFKVAAGDDVEVLLPDSVPPGALTGGETVYLSMSNEVKRRFPAPSYRPGDYPGIKPLAVELRLEPGAVEARAHDARGLGRTVCTRRELPLAPAREREASKAAAERAFSRLGGTDWHLESLALANPNGLFAPASVLTDLRRELMRLLADAA